MKITDIFRAVKNRLQSPEKYALSIGVKMGKGCYISTKDFSSEGYLIELGDYVRIAQHASFFTHGGIWSLRKYYNNPDLDHFGKIKVGSYTSIGAYCMIMPGVTIGERCIIGGGSVVTKSVPDGVMVAGNPAKFIGYTDDFYKSVRDKHDFKCKRMTHEEKKNYLLTLPDDKFIRKPYLKLPPNQ